MIKLSAKAQMLAELISEDFWEHVGYEDFCVGCDATGVHDPEQGCPAGDDPFSRKCYRHADAEDIEERIRELAASLA